jgi:hypothetical protein
MDFGQCDLGDVIQQESLEKIETGTHLGGCKWLPLPLLVLGAVCEE